MNELEGDGFVPESDEVRRFAATTRRRNYRVAGSALIVAGAVWIVVMLIVGGWLRW